MAQKLREGELDVALLCVKSGLTEAATLFAHKGYFINDVTIVGSFVDTPLTWGVHALAGSNPSLDSRYAVSRMGSGSHLIAALVAARQRGAPDPLFEVVGDLQGARKALKNKEADLFMWEKFTTKPRRIAASGAAAAEVPTPWPCFAVVCTPEVARSRRDEVSEVLGSVYEKASRISSADIDAIAADYHLKSDDVAEWLTGVKWGPGVRMPTSVIDECTRALLEAGVLEKGEVRPYSEVVSDWTRDEPLDA